jgi:hypothetical protein
LKCSQSGRLLAAKSSFGSHRSAINHLYRCHNRRGYGHNTSDHLRTLFKGLNRNIAQRAQTTALYRRGRANLDDGSATLATTVVVNEGNSHEAKDPMSVELFKLLLRGFLDWNASDGVFSYCYLLLTLTSYRIDNLVVDATSVAVNSSQIQQENKYHSEHKRKQIGYNNNREPQPLDNANCRIVR